MKSSIHVLTEWHMSHDHYEVQWDKVRKRLGDSLTDWLVDLPRYRGQTYIYHNTESNIAQLVVEFYDESAETHFLNTQF